MAFRPGQPAHPAPIGNPAGGQVLECIVGGVTGFGGALVEQGRLVAAPAAVQVRAQGPVKILDGGAQRFAAAVGGQPVRRVPGGAEDLRDLAPQQVEVDQGRLGRLLHRRIRPA